MNQQEIMTDKEETELYENMTYIPGDWVAAVFDETDEFFQDWINAHDTSPIDVSEVKTFICVSHKRYFEKYGHNIDFEVNFPPSFYAICLERYDECIFLSKIDKQSIERNLKVIGFILDNESYRMFAMDCMESDL